MYILQLMVTYTYKQTELLWVPLWVQFFLEINDFPLWVIKQIFAEEEQKYKHQNIEDKDSNVINIESGNKCHLLVLPYQGEQGSRLVKSSK